MAKMTKSELKALLQQQITTSLGYQGGKLSQQRMYNQKLYNGDPLGNEQKGRSQVVLRDATDVVEWIMPNLMKVFCSTDDVVEFLPQNPDDVDSAKQITSYVNYVFTKQNDGYEIYRTWFRDALISRNAFVKVYRDSQRYERTDEYEGLSGDALAQLLSQDGVEISGDIEIIMGDVDPMTGQPAETFNCTLRTVNKKSFTKVVPVPAEEILVSRRATSLKNADFVCHRVKRTKTDLIEMGYSKSVVEKLQSDTTQEFNMERLNRFQKDDEYPYETRTDEPMREIWINEIYTKVDWNNDGKAEWRKITAAGDNAAEILDNEECDGHPFIDLVPLPVPHKMFGLSVVDLVSDLQVLRTTIMRQVLDNLYISNTPRLAYVKGAVSVEDIMNHRPGAPIAQEQSGSVEAIQIPFVAGQSFQIMEYTDQLRESRTGVSAAMQGIDPNLLQSNTATVANLSSNAAAQRLELIAREFAETGVKRLFLKILELECKYQDKEITFLLDGKWNTVNPTLWKNQFDITVNVGLGTGNKDQNLAHLQQILQIQQAAIQQQGGVKGPLVNLQNVYNTVARISQNAGFKNAELFFSNPQDLPPQQQQPPAPPPPDPNMIAVQNQQMRDQANAQLEQQKFQWQQQKDQMEYQLRQQELQLKDQNEKAKISADIQLKELQLGTDKKLKMAEIFSDVMVQTTKIHMPNITPTTGGPI